MLGNIAKKLRLLGFDSEFLPDIEDNNLLEIMRKEQRILITKDKELAKKSEKQNLRAIFLTINDESEQFLQIKKEINLGNFAIEVNKTRCTLCNGELNLVEKNSVLEIVPDKVLKNIDKFWRCSSCSKIYWEGTHIKKLQEFVRRLNDK